MGLAVSVCAKKAGRACGRTLTRRAPPPHLYSLSLHPPPKHSLLSSPHFLLFTGPPFLAVARPQSVKPGKHCSNVCLACLLEEWSVSEAREEVHTKVDRHTWQMMVWADALALAWEPERKENRGGGVTQGERGGSVNARCLCVCGVRTGGAARPPEARARPGRRSRERAGGSARGRALSPRPRRFSPLAISPALTSARLFQLRLPLLAGHGRLLRVAWGG